jgi:hypothetical protein
MTATQDGKLRRALHGTLESLPPSPVPLETIIRRGRRIRLRRAGAAVGAVGLAGIIAVASPALRSGPPSPVPPAAPAITAGPGGVFARGTADGHPWRLAVQDIADPGYSCVPAIVLNDTDADPVYPKPGTAAVVALGSAAPGVGFAFVQLPADVSAVVVNDRTRVPAVAAAACGLRYRLAGFAYSLEQPLRVTAANSSQVFAMPVVSTQPPGRHTTPSSPGLWINTSSALGESAQYMLAWGTLPDGQEWSISLQFGSGGDCYELDGSGSAGNSRTGDCGPVSTPDGPETIMALPLGFPEAGSGATGYALPVAPSIGELKATLSDGSSGPATFCVVDGRDYAAFIVPNPLRLEKLTWYDAHGQAIASTTALPRYGYSQFQP